MLLGIGFLLPSHSGSPERRRGSARSPRRASQQDRRIRKLWRVVQRGPQAGQEPTWTFLRTALERHDLVIRQLTPDTLAEEPCLSFREHVVASLEEQVTKARRARPPEQFEGLPTTREEERRRQAVIGMLRRQAEQDRREREELLSNLDDVLSAFTD